MRAWPGSGSAGESGPPHARPFYRLAAGLLPPARLGRASPGGLARIGASVRQVREAAARVAPGEADPPVLAVKARQGLGHRQAGQLGLAQPGRVTRPAVFRQAVTGLHVQCGHQGAQAGAREGLRARRRVSNADPGHPRPLRHVTTRLMICKEPAWPMR